MPGLAISEVKNLVKKSRKIQHDRWASAAAFQLSLLYQPVCQFRWVRIGMELLSGHWPFKNYRHLNRFI
jgi:hypothetical protein